MKEMLINHINVTYGAIGFSGFWSFFQENAKYVIFAGGIYFAAKEWQNKSTGKMIMMILVAAILFVLTLDPQTVLQPLGQKIFEMIGAK